MHIVLYLCAAAVVISGSQLLLELAAPGGRVPPWQLMGRIWGRPVPPVAAGLTVLMAVMAVVQTVHPAVVGELGRDRHGPWWHVLTALLVESSGWFQLVINFAALIVIVPVAERKFGSWWTLLVYLVAGVTAQIVCTISWSPHGAGNSVAILGPLGALAVGYLLRGARRELRLLLLLMPAADIVLLALTNNHGVGLAVGCLFGLVLSSSVASRDDALVSR